MSWYGDFAPSISVAGGGTDWGDENTIIDQFEKALKLMRREALR